MQSSEGRFSDHNLYGNLVGTVNRAQASTINENGIDATPATTNNNSKLKHFL